MLVGERGVSPISASTKPRLALKRLVHLLLLQFGFCYTDLQHHPALQYTSGGFTRNKTASYQKTEENLELTRTSLSIVPFLTL